MVFVLLVSVVAGDAVFACVFGGAMAAGPDGAAGLCVAAGVAAVCEVDVLVVVVQLVADEEVEVPPAFGVVAVGFVPVQVAWVVGDVARPDVVAADAVGAAGVVG